MVDSVSSNPLNIAQLMAWFGSQQAQMAASLATGNMGTQTNNDTAASVQSVTGTSASGFTSGSPILGSESLAALFQVQQVSDTTGNANTPGQSNYPQSSFRQDFQNLTSAITSGDLAGAQQAYATLTSDTSRDSDSSATSQGKNSFQQALNQIGADLQSGNISGAQQTLSSLQQSQGAHGGHHHHHGGGESGGLASLLDGNSGSSSSASASSSSNTITETNADGSTTTITTNADGSVTTTTTPASQTASAGSSSGTNVLQDLLSALQKDGVT